MLIIHLTVLLPVSWLYAESNFHLLFNIESKYDYKIKEMFNNDATELYLSFSKNNQHLLQRISLGDIASYIGVSQVTLSRIRAKK